MDQPYGGDGTGGRRALPASLRRCRIRTTHPMFHLDLLRIRAFAFGNLAGLGARHFAAAGAIVSACAFIGLALLPVNFPYWGFATLTLFNGIGSGMFAAPNATMIPTTWLPLRATVSSRI